MPDAGASTAVDSPSTQGTESSSSDNVTTTPPIQEGASQQTTQEADPLAGIPSIEEITGDTVSKEAFVNLRGVYDKVKPQLDELTQNYSKFANYADRFSSPEEVQEIVDLKDKLFGWSRDDRNQLVPSTESAAQYLTEKYPQHANFLWADMAEGLTQHPETGQMVPRIDVALEGMRDDPVERAKALKILGGVEPSSIAPTWQRSAEDLEAILRDPSKPTTEELALQEVYKKLPYDEAESLKLNDPDFIRNYLKKEQFQQSLMEQNRVAQERETRQEQVRQQYQRQQAEQAGNQYVEQGFRQAMTEFEKSIVERSKFIQPLDPQSDAARQMEPQVLQQYNQQAEQINTGVGKMIAAITAAISHPDTRWMMEPFLKSVGVDDQMLQKYDKARIEYANNARMYGELNYSAQQPNGNENAQPRADIGTPQSNATRAMKDMKGFANIISKPLFELMSKYFEMKAGNYNATLNGTPSVRPSITGSAFDPTREATQRPARQPSEIWDRSAIERQAY